VGRGARLALLVAATVVLQGAVFPDLVVVGTVPDLTFVLAAAVAYKEGPDTAAVVGFAAGLGADLFLETPLGLTALSGALVGYGLGVVQASMLRSPRWVAPLLGGAAGIAGGLIFAAAGVVTGSEVLASWRTLQVMFRASVYDALLAPLVFVAVARGLREEREPVTAWRIR